MKEHIEHTKKALKALSMLRDITVFTYHKTINYLLTQLRVSFYLYLSQLLQIGNLVVAGGELFRTKKVSNLINVLAREQLKSWSVKKEVALQILSGNATSSKFHSYNFQEENNETFCNTDELPTEFVSKDSLSLFFKKEIGDRSCNSAWKIANTKLKNCELKHFIIDSLPTGNLNTRTQSVEVFIIERCAPPPRHLVDIPWSWLNEEKWRLATYANYPECAPKSPVLLAANGFAYKGTGRNHDDTVECYFCGLNTSKWQASDNIAEVHRELSPDCPMVTNVNCLDVPFNGQLPDHLHINTGASQTVISAPSLATAPVATATLSQTPNQKTSVGSASCPTYSDLGITAVELPKKPEYAQVQKRLETFSSWPRDHHLSPDQLADAGFYYAGYGDCARCFYCGGGLRNWEDEDDVWVEHARWFPKCAYIRQLMGQVFVDVVQDLNKTNDQISFQTVLGQMDTSSLRRNIQSGRTRENTNEHLQQPLAEALLEGRHSQSLTSSETEMDISHVQLPFNLNFITLRQRLMSFQGVQGNLPPHENLAEAGFYYAGRLHSLGQDADIWTLHASAYPNCGYVRLLRGTAYVNSFRINNSSDDVVPANRPMPGANRSMPGVNQEVHPRLLCRSCHVNPIALLFLPCGHLLFCLDCGIAAAICFRCGRRVQYAKYVRIA